jgi:four helix bundle protein
MSQKDPIQDYRDLSVWQLGMDLAVEVYQLTKGFPNDEKFGLTSQLRRATASVPANIAEGHSRASTKEYLRHLSIALGSIAEVTTFLELAKRVGYVDCKRLDSLLDQFRHERRMLRGLQASLRKHISQS